MKAIPAAVISAMGATEPRPIELITVAVTGATYRFATAQAAVSFGGNTYNAWEIRPGSLEQETDSQIDRLTIKLDDIEGTIRGYHNARSFVGALLSRWRVYQGAMSDSSYYDEVFHGRITKVRFPDTWIQLEAIQGMGLEYKYPIREFGPNCPHIFGGAQCNQDDYADLTALTRSGTADSGTTTTLVDSILTEADDFWNYGRIVITKGGVTEEREVSDFTASSDTITWLIPLSFTVDNTTTYAVYKGCDKTWDTCMGLHAWGPSNNNLDNFGGFRHMARRKLTGA